MLGNKRELKKSRGKEGQCKKKRTNNKQTEETKNRGNFEQRTVAGGKALQEGR